MSDLILHLTCAIQAHSSTVRHRLATTCRGDAGEGVISAAIAVLIMAALGVVMWVGFQEIWGEAKANTQNEVTRIGS